VIVEVQQNSDTTYRVFDWNRTGLDGVPRKLHIEESMASIDFEDFEPAVNHLGKGWCRMPISGLRKRTVITHACLRRGTVSIVTIVSGAASCAGADFKPGDFFLARQSLGGATVNPRQPKPKF
jgi:mannose-6-phosphate isomerase